MLRIGLGAAALLFASAAQAQSADEFRVVAGNDAGLTLVSTLASGPKSARKLTQLIVRQERSPSGADAYSVAVTVDCGAGSLALGLPD